MKAKKILQIKKGEYLLEILENGRGIKSTYNENFALDVSNWSLEQLGHIVSSLKKVGYTKAKVLTIEPLPIGGKNAELKLGKNIFDSANEIGEALKSVKERAKSDEV